MKTENRSVRIVHVVFDRVRRHLETHHVGHLQFDVGVDEVVVEDAAGLQEVAVLIEAVERLAQQPQTVGISFSSSGGRS